LIISLLFLFKAISATDVYQLPTFSLDVALKFEENMSKTEVCLTDW